MGRIDEKSGAEDVFTDEEAGEGGEARRGALAWKLTNPGTGDSDSATTTSTNKEWE